MTKQRYNFLLPFSLFLLIISVTAPALLHAQAFDKGLQEYRQGNYENAISAFKSVNSPQGYLFTGKSFYSLGRYEVAQSNLNNITDDAPAAIRYEARYTSALIDFQLKNFGQSLSNLYQVANADFDEDLTSRANNLYREILNYLSFKQREQAIDDLDEDAIKYDIMASGLGKLTYRDAQELYDLFRDNTDDEWRDKGEDFESYLDDASAYEDEYGEPADRLQPPKGTVYNLGIALPEFNPSDQEFEVVKAMYFGAMLAAENFNDDNSTPKAYVRFSDTGSSEDRLDNMVEQLNSNYRGDAIVGPLFSEQAESLIPIVTDAQIPTIAPLANSQIDNEDSFLFQANPTYEVHGIRMAQYAVNELGHKNFAVIASNNSNGAESAKAFREEAQRLGANINYYAVEDLESNEHEISRYTRQFGSDEPIEAVYAPFTGRLALNLIDLLILDLRSLGISPVILGSPEYQNLDFSANKYRDIDISFSVGTHENVRSSGRYQFNTRYKRQFGMNPNQFAMIGYDVTSFILNALSKVGNPDLLRETIRIQDKYEGLVRDINFDGKNINQAVKFYEVTSAGELRAQN